jgi:hypothetical protein
VARARSAGVSGVAVTAGALGLFLAYSGVRDIPPLEGLRAALRGDNPGSLARTPGKVYEGPTSSSPSSTPAGFVGTAGAGFGGPVGMAETELVAGIRVNRAIASSVRSMVAAASADGIRLYGFGWRSSLTQAALRLSHGYTSDTQRSGSGGRTPVAVPGSSRHEAGLAIDFVDQGGASLSRADREYKWLSQNAARFGFKNLPSEPWHWSTDGK